MPAFTASRANELVAGSGIEFPRMNHGLLGKYLDYWCQTGFIVPAAQAAAV